MSQSSAWIAMEKQYYAQTVRRQPVVLVRGQGCRVWDADGKEYLGDFRERYYYARVRLLR
jgi:acetylornithine/succinyldiaminopimelate/putrescine aminotransferase